LAKNLKLNIKNTQIAQGINLAGIKGKLAKEKAATEEAPSKKSATTKEPSAKAPKEESEDISKAAKEEAPPRIRARSKSVFAEPPVGESKTKTAETEQEAGHEISEPVEIQEVPDQPKESHKRKTSEELRKEIFAVELEERAPPTFSLRTAESDAANAKKAESTPPPPVEMPPQVEHVAEEKKGHVHVHAPSIEKKPAPSAKQEAPQPVKPVPIPYEKLGPTGRHVKDLIPPPRPKAPFTPPPPRAQPASARQGEARPSKEAEAAALKDKSRVKPKGFETPAVETEEKKGGAKTPKAKEFHDLKPTRKTETHKTFDARDRQGLRSSEEDQTWRKRRHKQHKPVQEDITIRPTSLKIRIPISIKDLAAEMKLKSSQLVAKLFMQGVVATLNDLLEDETTLQLLGQEFGCEIAIDTSEEQRIRVTDKSIREEISNSNPDELEIRPPIVAFMGHVDHGKTSLIDKIRESNRAAGEAGAITQHIGAFKCHTPVGDIAILDTPGHEAFSAMRARGADVTDIVVLVIAGDEGIRQQTIEAIQHAKAAKVTIVVALNKCDKPNFNQENVYRQLAEQELLPEAWGGQTITVNCSAVTGEGIQNLLEMLALQAEVLELRANPKSRARGTVLESEMHKGMGSVATVLVQNGVLRLGDALVFGQTWGRVKTMQDEFRHEFKEATPSTPVEITGLSGMPEAGEEFVVVQNEREARNIAEARMQGIRQSSMLMKKKLTMENLFQQASDVTTKKTLNIILRADVQGSLEALKAAVLKIESQKCELNVIFTGVGEVSESDVQLAAASKAVILGFHTQIESHADSLVKQLGIQVRLHNIIYHAVDDVKALMLGTLDKVAVETEKGKAEVKATFKSSHYGIIAGCMVTEGTIHRNNHVRVRRGNEVIWKGPISSLKRVKEDVREVAKGFECGIVLSNFTAYLEGDILESYEVTYIMQEL